MQEETVWEGTSSHVVRLGTYLLCLLFCWLVIPIFIAIWKAIELKSTRYRLTTERIRVTTGILSKQTEEVELYRVRDISLEQPFRYRVFGKGNLVLTTSDESAPTLSLEAIPRPGELLDVVRKHVEHCRDRKRVREIDIDMS
ncbi:PH domain-containing protein [Salinithrix halophila]|uniref:PH domain-containing protein n=1 Tax=Salinithrix halophila TaxID=1485204 RepID=A0ABV8JKJ2_9BACL